MRFAIILFISLFVLAAASCGGLSAEELDTLAEHQATTLIATYEAWLPTETILTATPTRIPTPTPRTQATASDEYNPATDLLEADSTLDGETLEVTLTLKDLPPELEFDRPGVDEYSMEYEWGVAIDLDNDPQTGDPDGYDYFMTVYHIKGMTEADLEADLWRYDMLDDSTESLGIDVSYDLDAVSETVWLRGNIEGITEESRLSYFAYDYFAGEDRD